MKPSRYEVFLKVVEFGSITEAAHYFNYTQSAVSQIVTSLEQEIGLTLLTRNRSGSTLTNAGMELIPYIRSIGSSIDHFTEHISDILNLHVGTIRLGTFSSVSCHWLPALIRDFQEIYPQISFHILQGSYSEIETWIVNGTVDCGFVSSPKTKGLDTIHLYDDPMKVILPPNHCMAEADVFPLSQLTGESYIYLTDGDTEIYQKIFKRHDVHVDIHYRIRDDYTVMAMVESNLGISILPELVLHRSPYNIVQKSTDDIYFRKLGISVKNKDEISPSCRRFLHFIRQNLPKYHK